MWYKEDPDFFLKEQLAISGRFPDIHFKIINGKVHLIGRFKFIASYEDVDLSDLYHLDIFFPDNYPNYPPSVKEIGGRIPLEYHHLLNGDLCLGTEIQVLLKFRENKCIIHYIDNILTHYLYRFTYIQRFQKEPYPDRRHITQGVIDAYRELLQIPDTLDMIKFLQCVLKRTYREYESCPCGSGLKTSDCHGEILKQLISIPRNILGNNLVEMQSFLKEYFTPKVSRIYLR